MDVSLVVLGIFFNLHHCQGVEEEQDVGSKRSVWNIFVSKKSIV